MRLRERVSVKTTEIRTTVASSESSWNVMNINISTLMYITAHVEFFSPDSSVVQRWFSQFRLFRDLS